MRLYPLHESGLPQGPSETLEGHGQGARSFDLNNEHRACQGPSRGSGESHGVPSAARVLLARHKYPRTINVRVDTIQPFLIDSRCIPYSILQPASAEISATGLGLNF